MIVTDKAQRKQLTQQYKQNRPEAGVYRIVNTKNGRFLLGSATDLGNIRNKLEFAASTGMQGVLDRRLHADIKQFGIDAFTLEIVETLTVTPEMTRDELRRDLMALE